MKAKNHNRRKFLETLGLYSASMAAPNWLAAQELQASKKLNFVFILADDLGWSDLPCYGGDLHETPNLDRFARQAMRFTGAYAASPVCTPTRASIMTGKYPARLNMTIWRESAATPPQKYRHLPPVVESDLPHEEITIAEALNKAGYRTAHIGKWHLGDAEHYPETQGFDVNIGGTLWGAPTTFFYPYSGSGTFGSQFRYVPHLELGEEGEYLTDRLTSEAIRVMDAMKDDPFFLHLAYHTVHTPIEGKPETVERYRDQIEPGMRHTNPGYAAMVHSLDENVGRVLQKIDELGIADHTAVIFFSDNGGYLSSNKYGTVTDNSPLRSGKGSLYEGGVRVPLMVRWPGVTQPGSVCDQAVSSIDFYPSLLEMAGVSGDSQHNADVDGISLVPLLKNPHTPLNREALYWHYPHYYPTTSPVSSIRQGDWKLIEFFEDGHLELYNLKDDLSEKNNLASTLSGKATELHDRLKAWRKEVDAPRSRPNPNFKPGGLEKGF